MPLRRSASASQGVVPGNAFDRDRRDALAFQIVRHPPNRLQPHIRPGHPVAGLLWIEGFDTRCRPRRTNGRKRSASIPLPTSSNAFDRDRRHALAFQIVRHPSRGLQPHVRPGCPVGCTALDRRLRYQMSTARTNGKQTSVSIPLPTSSNAFDRDRRHALAFQIVRHPPNRLQPHILPGCPVAPLPGIEGCDSRCRPRRTNGRKRSARASHCPRPATRSIATAVMPWLSKSCATHPGDCSRMSGRAVR